MDAIEAASLLLGTQKTSGANKSSTNIILGDATSNSSGGYVMVNLGGVAITGDGEQSTSLPTTVDVRKGDTVQVSLVGVSGKAKTPTVIGVVGGGDRTRTDIENAEQNAIDTSLEKAKEQTDKAVSEAKSVIDTNMAALDTTIKETKAIANATNQYFSHDTNGVHVSNTAGNPAGEKNVLLNSQGMVLRENTNIYASFGPSQVSYYDGSGTEKTDVIAQYTSTSAQIGKSDTRHITLGDEGIVLSEGDKNLASFTKSSMSFYDGAGNDASNMVAQFGANNARIGKSNSDNVIVDNRGMLINQGNTTYAHFTKDSAQIGRDNANNVYIDEDEVSIRQGSKERLSIKGDSITLDDLTISANEYSEIHPDGVHEGTELNIGITEKKNRLNISTNNASIVLDNFEVYISGGNTTFRISPPELFLTTTNSDVYCNLNKLASFLGALHTAEWIETTVNGKAGWYLFYPK